MARIGIGKQRMRAIDADIRRAAEAFETERRDQIDATAKAARQAERDRVRLTREDIEGAAHVLISRTWYPVVTVNTTTVTVLGYDLAGRPEKVRHPFSRVREVR